MRAYAVILDSTLTVSASISTIGAEARIVDDSISASTLCLPAMKAMAAILLGLTLVVAQPQRQIAVQGCCIEEVGGVPYPWVSNFQTSDGMFVMTADGRIFFCREVSL